MKMASDSDRLLSITNALRELELNDIALVVESASANHTEMRAKNFRDENWFDTCIQEPMFIMIWTF